MNRRDAKPLPRARSRQPVDALAAKHDKVGKPFDVADRSRQ